METLKEGRGQGPTQAIHTVQYVHLYNIYWYMQAYVHAWVHVCIYLFKAFLVGHRLVNKAYCENRRCPLNKSIYFARGLSPVSHRGLTTGVKLQYWTASLQQHHIIKLTAMAMPGWRRILFGYTGQASGIKCMSLPTMAARSHSEIASQQRTNQWQVFVDRTPHRRSHAAW